MSGFVFAVALFSVCFCLQVNVYTLQITYPLWQFAGPNAFGPLHREYLRRLGWVVTAPHVLMFFSCAALIFRHPPPVPGWLCWAVCGLAWTVVGVSAFVAGPVHDRFAREGVLDDPGFRLLMRVSLGRVLLMGTACALLLWAAVLLFR